MLNINILWIVPGLYILFEVVYLSIDLEGKEL